LVVIVSPRVSLEDVNVRCSSEPLQHGLGVTRIDLQGVQSGRLAGQSGGENPPARADFQHGLAGRKGGNVHDFFDNEPIAQKHLPQALAAMRNMSCHKPFSLPFVDPKRSKNQR
jgi:hypothetical protein